MNVELVNTNSQPSLMARHGQKIVALVFWAIIVSGGFVYAAINNLTFNDLLLQVVDLFKSPVGPLIYILIYAIRPLTFLSAAALTLAAGSIFGAGGPFNMFLAIVYTVVASHVSASVAYMVGRYFGKGLIKKEADEEDSGFIQNWAKRLRENTFEAVLTMRVLFLPFDLVSYLAGFLRVSWLKFIVGSIVGSIAGTVAFVSVGASLSIEAILAGERPEFNMGAFAFGLVLALISIGISQYLKRRETQRKAQIEDLGA